MKISLFAFIMLLLAHYSLCMNPPLWAQKFAIEFKAKISNLRTNGKYWYNQIQNSQRLDVDNGNVKDLCGSILNSNTSCTILTKKQATYFIFPQKNICCSQAGFPIRRQDWLDNFDFKGEEILGGESSYLWVSKTETVKYYEDQSAQRIPKREQYAGGRAIFDYETNSYTLDFDSNEAFSVPSYCKRSCQDLDRNLEHSKKQLIQ